MSDDAPATPARARRGWMLLAQFAIGAIAIALTWRRLRADWGQVNWSSVSIDTTALVTACR